MPCINCLLTCCFIYFGAVKTYRIISSHQYVVHYSLLALKHRFLYTILKKSAFELIVNSLYAKLSVSMETIVN